MLPAWNFLCKKVKKKAFWKHLKMTVITYNFTKDGLAQLFSP